MEQAIITSAYWGPIVQFSIFARYKKAIIEQFDSYHKQTWRNRCQILSANGTLDLTVPVVKNSGVKTLTKDIEIDYATAWQKNHWRSICSAYNSSPYFEYFIDEMVSFYVKKWKYLIDLNNETTLWALKSMRMDADFDYSEKFIHQYAMTDDFREIVSPKKAPRISGKEIEFCSYTQTFSETHPFTPNLSILDLLCNCGPESEHILMKTVF
jgi:hypothetical protein